MPAMPKLKQALERWPRMSWMMPIPNRQIKSGAQLLANCAAKKLSVKSGCLE